MKRVIPILSMCVVFFLGWIWGGIIQETGRIHAQTEKAIATTPKPSEVKFDASDVAELSEIQTARKAKLDQLQSEIERVNTEAGQKIMTILGKYGYKDDAKLTVDAKGHWLGFTEPETEKKP